MKTNLKVKHRIYVRFFHISVAIMLFLYIGTSMASGKNDNYYELQANEYDNAAMCDLILDNLGSAKRRAANNGGGKVTRISYQTTPPFEPIFQYKEDSYLLADYIIIDNIKIRIIHIVKGMHDYKMDREYIFNMLGIDPNIKSEELSAWCDKLHIIMKLDQKRLLEVEVFTELNE